MIRSARILVVEDAERTRKLLVMLLGVDGYAVTGAASGTEALAAVGARPPDLILLDAILPDIDGFDITRRLKVDPATANVPIIMLTARTDRAARLAGLEAGAEEFLAKPVDRAELSLRVRNLLRLKDLRDRVANNNVLLEQEVQSRTADLQRFRFALDRTGDAIMLIDRPSLRFLEVNRTTCALLGYSHAEMLELRVEDCFVLNGVELTAAYDALIARLGAGSQVETHLRRKDGVLVPVEIRKHAHDTGTGWIIVAVARDIAERKEAQARLYRLAHYDPLTGLPNRLLFEQAVTAALVAAAEGGWKAAVVCVDLDDFKEVNDRLGRVMGDELLRRVGLRLVESVPACDIVGRIGADAFAVVVVLREDGTDRADAAHRVARIRDALRVPFEFGGNAYTATACVGTAVFPDDAQDATTLMKFADIALDCAKQAGRSTARGFTAQMSVEMVARLELAEALRLAVDNEEFVLHYQPIVRLETGRIVGLEALLRWQRPGRGLVPPHEFISVLEATGLICRVGRWVLSEACRQLGTWSRGPLGRAYVSVNVSGHQFADGDLAADVARALRDNGVDADQLEIELTESALITHSERSIDTLRRLKQTGVRISVDDFGTGYSSLAYLRRFPIDKVKIDVAFIRELTTNPGDDAIVRAIIAMAHELKLEVTAEGVESAAQLACLRRHGCDYLQGFLFSPALPARAAHGLLREQRRLPMASSADAETAQTLLLVDDDPHVLSALQRMLRPDGYRILATGAPEEAFELLALHPVQVIVCDQRVTSGGPSFLDRATALYPNTIRIVLSGYTDLASIIDAINRGAIYRFFTKPWDDEVLRDNIREAFRQYARLRGVVVGPPDHGGTPESVAS